MVAISFGALCIVLNPCDYYYTHIHITCQEFLKKIFCDLNHSSFKTSRSLRSNLSRVSDREIPSLSAILSSFSEAVGVSIT